MIIYPILVVYALLCSEYIQVGGNLRKTELKNFDMKYISPEYKKSSFHCPLCTVFSEQVWSYHSVSNFEFITQSGHRGNSQYDLPYLKTAKCQHCQDFSLWIGEKMVYPLSGTIEPANLDLPEDIKNDYNEAKDIINISPRGSAALLRLAVQKLCIHLGEKGKNINDDIESLVKKGLPKTMQQALDSVRVIGNNAVHPGTIDLNDKAEIAHALFGFLNIICEVLISQPKRIQEFYEKNLPQGIRDNIEKRDN